MPSEWLYHCLLIDVSVFGGPSQPLQYGVWSVEVVCFSCCLYSLTKSCFLLEMHFCRSGIRICAMQRISFFLNVCIWLSDLEFIDGDFHSSITVSLYIFPFEGDGDIVAGRVWWSLPIYWNAVDGCVKVAVVCESTMLDFCIKLCLGEGLLLGDILMSPCALSLLGIVCRDLVDVVRLRKCVPVLWELKWIFFFQIAAGIA